MDGLERLNAGKPDGNGAGLTSRPHAPGRAGENWESERLRYNQVQSGVIGTMKDYSYS